VAGFHVALDHPPGIELISGHFFHLACWCWCWHLGSLSQQFQGQLQSGDSLFGCCLAYEMSPSLWIRQLRLSSFCQSRRVCPPHRWELLRGLH
jgi:hypothetical protein